MQSCHDLITRPLSNTSINLVFTNTRRLCGNTKGIWQFLNKELGRNCHGINNTLTKYGNILSENRDKTATFDTS